MARCELIRALEELGEAVVRAEIGEWATPALKQAAQAWLDAREAEHRPARVSTQDRSPSLACQFVAIAPAGRCGAYACTWSERLALRSR